MSVIGNNTSIQPSPKADVLFRPIITSPLPGPFRGKPNGGAGSSVPEMLHRGARRFGNWSKRARGVTRQVRNKTSDALSQLYIWHLHLSQYCEKSSTPKRKITLPTRTIIMTSSPPTGVFVPVPTFFKPQSECSSLQPDVDVQAQIDHSVFLAKNGVRGLVLLGSTGEAIHMSRQERIDLVSGVRKGLDKAGFKDYPIMAGTLINSVDETLEWLEDFKNAGAQWGLVLAPGYFGAAASQEGIREWYTIVADKSSLPVLM